LKRKRLRWQAVNHGRLPLLRPSIPIGWRLRLLRENFSQPIGMLGRSSGNHDWLLANASACVSMETGLDVQA